MFLSLAYSSRFISLILLFFFPPLLHAYGYAQSLGVAYIICSLLCLLFFCFEKIKISKVFIIFFSIACLYTFLSPHSLFLGEFYKQILSIIGILICGTCISMLFKRMDIFLLLARNIFYLLSIIGVLGVFKVEISSVYTEFNRGVFPFLEPSHFALIYIPFALIFILNTSEKLLKLILFFLFLMAFSFPNLTLLVGTILISMVVLRIRFIFLMLLAILLGAFIIDNNEYFQYFYERVDVSNDGSENLSMLVYLQGWEKIKLSLIHSNFIGLGFQNLGSEPFGNYYYLIKQRGVEGLNWYDGSFLASKIIGEFGFLGAFLVFFLLCVSLSSGIILRKNFLKWKIFSTEDQVCLVFVYILIIELLVRGVGYFSPIFFTALYFLPRVIDMLYLLINRNFAINYFLK